MRGVVVSYMRHIVCGVVWCSYLFKVLLVSYLRHAIYGVVCDENLIFLILAYRCLQIGYAVFDANFWFPVKQAPSK